MLKLQRPLNFKFFFIIKGTVYAAKGIIKLYLICKLKLVFPTSKKEECSQFVHR